MRQNDMRIKSLRWIVTFSLGVSSTLAWSQSPKAKPEHAHEHAHEHHGAEPALTLDHGKKWATDAPLREGMANIRKIMKESSVKPTPEGNQRAAGRMNEEIQKIFKTCKLTPKADANLHLVLAEMMKGTGALKDASLPAAEAYGRISKALDLYGQHFDHPGWSPAK
jgi:hypothetical protein